MAEGAPVDFIDKPESALEGRSAGWVVFCNAWGCLDAGQGSEYEDCSRQGYEQVDMEVCLDMQVCVEGGGEVDCCCEDGCGHER